MVIVILRAWVLWVECSCNCDRSGYFDEEMKRERRGVYIVEELYSLAPMALE